MGTFKFELKKIKLKKNANAYDIAIYPGRGVYEITNPLKGDIYQEKGYFVVEYDPISTNILMVFTIPKIPFVEIEETQPEAELIEEKENLVNEDFALKMLSVALSTNTSNKTKISDL